MAIGYMSGPRVWFSQVLQADNTSERLCSCTDCKWHDEANLVPHRLDVSRQHASVLGALKRGVGVGVAVNLP